MCKHCWDDSESEHHKDFIRGGVDPEYGEVEVNYKSMTKTKAKRVKKNYPGCPGNDGGPHVYVWTEEYEFKDLFYRFYGFFRKQTEACCGCSKKKRYKNSDKYEARKRREYDKRYGGNEFNVKRGEPVPRYGRNRVPSYRWWTWENQDDDYNAYHKEYIDRHGWNSYVYGF